MTQNTREKINSIAKQFLCNVPFNTFDWHTIFDGLILNEDLQKTLLDKTVNSRLVLKLPPRICYQKYFLKHMIENLERLHSCATQDAVICDDLYSAYGRLVALPSSSQSFKHYLLAADDKVISLKESSNLISDGTTGLRTWQAALALSEWMIQNKDFFKNKTVLELGSGIGLAGLVLAKECLPRCALLTDCHEIVLKTLSGNVELNFKQQSTDTVVSTTSNKSNCCCPIRHRCVYHQNSKPPQIHVLNLPWEEIDREECDKLSNIEIVIAADIIYDDELFEPLVKAMKNLAMFSGVKEFIFCCTIRNPSTIELFLNKIDLASFAATRLDVPSQKIFLWPTDTPVEIYSFTLNK